LGRKHFLTFHETHTFTQGVTVFAKFRLFLWKVFAKTIREKWQKYRPITQTVLKIVIVTFENVTTLKSLFISRLIFKSELSEAFTIEKQLVKLT
jgi:hypothetical protein